MAHGNAGEAQGTAVVYETGLKGGGRLIRIVGVRNAADADHVVGGMRRVFDDEPTAFSWIVEKAFALHAEGFAVRAHAWKAGRGFCEVV